MPLSDRGPFIDPKDQRLVTREWGHAQGWYGRVGGWIYDHQDQPVTQGWDSVWFWHRRVILDWLTVRLTAFETFDAMRTAPLPYRPSIYERDRRHRLLADAYDLAQEKAGDARRAYRGSRRLLAAA